MILILLAACSRAPALDSAPYAGVLAQADTDHDGALSEAEYAAAAPPVSRTFATADLDHDGSLTRDELAELTHHADPAWYDPALAPRQRSAGGAGRGGKGGKRGGGGPGISEDAAEQPDGAGSGFDASGPPFATGDAGGGAAAKAPKRPAGPLPGSAGPTVGSTRGGGDARHAETLREVLLFEVAEIVAANPAATVPTAAEVDRAATAGIASPECAVVLGTLKKAATAAGLVWPEGLDAPASR